MGGPVSGGPCGAGRHAGGIGADRWSRRPPPGAAGNAGGVVGVAQRDWRLDGGGAVIILGLETCTPSGGMALMEFGGDGCGRVLAAEVMLAGRAQSGLLGEAIQAALAELGMRMEQVGVVAVSNGPGSFTGVRVGLSLAKGLCILSGGPRMVCVSSLEALV